MKEEWFPLVDEKGETIGKATRKECHSGSKMLHPVVHLHIFNKAGDLYLQKRSINKDIQPGKWDTAVGGHIDYGETVEDALEFFRNIPTIHRKIQTLYDVGLSYVKLGQPSTTLSGGEAQRIKLATELSKRSTGRTIYILDEPTTGLHFADVHKLIEILQRLTEGGNSVVVIEHNLDVIKTADYIIDMGPGGGEEGGRVVACGTPEQIAANEESVTGKYL